MIRAIFTIARRDITATILSRGFLIWLAMPVIGLAFGVLASLAGGGRPAPAPASVAVIDTGGDFAPWVQAVAARERTRNAYERLRTQHRAKGPLPAGLSRPSALLSDSDLDALARRGDLAAFTGNAPAFVAVTAEADPAAQARRLLGASNTRFGAVLIAAPSGLTLLASGKSVDAERIRTLAGLAWMRRALAAEGLDARVDAIRAAQPNIAVEVLDRQSKPTPGAQAAPVLSTGAATVLFALISLLAGALLSNMVEEKSNKIIEVLVAAVPVPAIYAGKLIAMLIVSLIGVSVWGLLFGGGAMLAAAQLPAGLLPVPPRGWPELLALGLAYFVCAYLIYGAIYLGIGSLCSTIREVQTLSMPVTILQMVILISTLGALANPGSFWFEAVSWFPLSAPYMMLGRAATDTGLGVHFAAILWQLAFAAFVIALAARLFRYGVLRSGPPPTLRQLAGLKLARS